MRTRIICIGNRFCAADAAGPMVYDILACSILPPSVELVDGGLAGLRLLPLLEDCDQVVFVDAVAGFLGEPGVVVLDPATVDPQPAVFGHQDGLAYLLQAAPHVLTPPLPNIVVVGIEGPATAPVCRQAADVCLVAIRSEDGRATHFQTVCAQ